MKSLIRFTTIATCCLVLGCGRSEETPIAPKKEKAAVRQEKETTEKNTPPLVVQQFMGCKAHR